MMSSWWLQDDFRTTQRALSKHSESTQKAPESIQREKEQLDFVIPSEPKILRLVNWMACFNVVYRGRKSSLKFNFFKFYKLLQIWEGETGQDDNLQVRHHPHQEEQGEAGQDVRIGGCNFRYLLGSLSHLLHLLLPRSLNHPGLLITKYMLSWS